jgi:hypothetical protein
MTSLVTTNDAFGAPKDDSMSEDMSETVDKASLKEEMRFLRLQNEE